MQTISIQDSVSRLRRLHFLEREMMRSMAGWLPAVAELDVKLTLGRHIHEDVQHADMLRARLLELPGGLPDREPDPALSWFMEELIQAPSAPAFLSGLHMTLKRRMLDAYERFMEVSDPLFEAPTQDVIRRITADEAEQARIMENYFAAFYGTSDAMAAAEEWSRRIDSLLAECGGADGTESPRGSGEVRFDPRARPPFRVAMQVARDRRFPPPTFGRMPVPDEVVAGTATQEHVFPISCYLNEIQAVETLAMTIYELRTMPWEFYVDAGRHCWDEVRHVQMGFRRLQQMGIDVYRLPLMTGNAEVRALLDPLHRYAYITMVNEASSFKIKQQWLKMYEEAGDRLSADLISYDMADERTHVHLGKRWLPVMQKQRNDLREISEVVEDAERQFAYLWERLTHLEADPD